MMNKKSTNRTPAIMTNTAKNSKRKNQTMSKFKSNTTRYHHNKPAELFRTDFITAMKLPDTESLDDDSYWVIKDQWKLDWEKGVQVPVKPDQLNTPNYIECKDQFDLPEVLAKTIRLSNNVTHLNNSKENNPPVQSIKMPKKYLCPANDKNYKPQIHQAYITHGLYNDSIKNDLTVSNNLSICKYDSDQMDLLWLNRINLELELMGAERLTRSNLERLIENFELQSYENLKQSIDKLQSYSIEYDEDIVCDVCHSPDSEENNEMVFCDGCNMCVHQACYGIEKIPKGNWLCSPCTFGGSNFRPECVLCPNTNGAMKPTKNYRNWAHVSCALWIPETGFGNPDKMEPIVNLNHIAPARWQLVCSLCKEKRGCCLQCTEKRCHSAFHVTCAFKFNLEMQTIVNENNSEDLIFKAYCLKHTKRRQLSQQLDEEEEEEEDDNDNENDDDDEETDKPADAGSSSTFPPQTSTSTSPNKHNLNESTHEQEKNFFNSLSKMTENERKLAIIKQIKLLNYEFYKNVNLTLTENLLMIKNPLHINLAFNYWKMKRRFNISTISCGNNAVLPIQNKPLIVYRSEQDLINRNERLLIAKIRMFIHLRQDLERVRNLCYMVAKREKLKTQFYKLKQTLFGKQVEYINRYLSQNDLSILNSSNRGGRLKEILQIKNDQCIYDHPELWSDNVDSITVAPSTAIESINLDTDDHKPALKKQKQKKKTNELTIRKNKLAKNILNKYNMLNYRRSSNSAESRKVESQEAKDSQQPTASKKTKRKSNSRQMRNSIRFKLRSRATK